MNADDALKASQLSAFLDRLTAEESAAEEDSEVRSWCCTVPQPWGTPTRSPSPGRRIASANAAAERPVPWR
eukprot:10776799-Prorocentrum_lima.AAC.1